MRRLFLAAAAALSACRAHQGPPRAAARAELRDVSGTLIGSAWFVPANDGVELEIEVSGLPPGLHGMHVHEFGRCEPPSFESAGGHLNPSSARHGLGAPGGPHAGDMPNLAVFPDGTAKARLLLPRATLGAGDASLLRPGGAALMIHSGPDDQTSDPSGGSGARVACGVINRLKRLSLKRVLKKMDPVPR